MSETTIAVEQGQDDPHNVQYWSARWTENRIGFHKSYVAPTLLKNIELVTGQKLTSEPLKDEEQLRKNSEFTWFMPLCGKSVDIPYLLSQGFKVFGVEGVRLAIDELEKEQNLGLVLDEKTSVFTGAGGKLKIFFGDLFQCPVEEFGPFHFVWDRGSFVALEYPHRQAYSEVMQRGLNKNGHKFRYLMETILYDKEKFEGPPRSVTDEDMETYFRCWAKTEFLSEEVPPEDSTIFKKLDGQASLRSFLITPKN